MTIRRAQPRSRAISAAIREARLEQRARLIGAGLELPAKRAKFRNVKTTYNGVTYDSVGEAEYAHKLDMLLAAGQIVHWERPKPFVLLDAPNARDRITYKPDFWVIPIQAGPRPSRDYTYSYYVDYKGSTVDKHGKRHTPTETEAWRNKVKMWKDRYPDLELRVAYPDGVERQVAGPTTT